MRNNRKWIVLVFTIATFVTLRITMGPRHHGHGMHPGCTKELAPAEQH